MTEIAHGLLHVALQAAVDEERLLLRNPCADLRDKPRTKYNPQDRPILSLQLAKDILACVRGSRYYLPFLLAITTGMRRSEIVGLRWQNIHPEDGFLRVCEQRQPDHQGKLTIQPVKTESSNREVPLPTDVAAELKTHRDNINPEPDMFLCLNRRGTPLRPDNLDHEWRRVRIKLGLPSRITFHDIRHSWTNWQAEAGTDIKTVSVVLGHKDERVTLSVYRAVTDKMRRRAASALEGLAQDGATADHGTDVERKGAPR